MTTQKQTTTKSKKLKPQTQETTEEVPKDLVDLWASVVAISTCHNVLQEGSFHFRYNNAIGVSLKFLEGIHKQALDAAASHPKAHMIPEIKTLVEKQAPNGKEQ